MQAHAAPGIATFPELSLTAANINLKEKYRLTRKALVKAGLDIHHRQDGRAYRDWRRWRDLESIVPVDGAGVGKVEQCWGRTGPVPMLDGH